MDKDLKAASMDAVDEDASILFTMLPEVRFNTALRIVSRKLLKRLVSKFRRLTSSEQILQQRNNVKQPINISTKKVARLDIRNSLTCYIRYTIQKLDG